MGSKTFFDGESVVNRVEIGPDKIDCIGLQKRTNVKNILLAYPNSAGFAPAAVPRAAFTCIWVKAEIKAVLLYNTHCFIFEMVMPL